jgi:uncharacterized membrane protein
MLRVMLRSTAVVALLAGLTQPASQVHGAQASEENAVVGTLSGYEAKSRVLTVRVEKDLQTFVLADKASVHLGSRVLPESEIAAQTGHKVKVRFTEKGGKRLASSVMLSPER